LDTSEFLPCILFQISIPSPLPSETACDDGLDDDGDGAADCADDAACAGAANEVCGNGANDDGDDIADCADPDCAAARSNVGLCCAGCLLSLGGSEAGKVSAILLFSLLLAGLALLRKWA
jgi:hypothetical protein